MTTLTRFSIHRAVRPSPWPLVYAHKLNVFDNTRTTDDDDENCDDGNEGYDESRQKEDMAIYASSLPVSVPRRWGGDGGRKDAAAPQPTPPTVQPSVSGSSPSATSSAEEEDTVSTLMSCCDQVLMVVALWMEPLLVYRPAPLLPAGGIGV